MTIDEPTVNEARVLSSVAGAKAGSRLPAHSYKLLDAWRGIAALWVVMVHSCLSTIVNEYPNLAHQPLYAFSLFGALGVPIFFVISGYCIAGAACSSARRPNPIQHFALARFRRIYPPYFFATVAGIAGAIVLTYLVAHHKLQNSDPNFLHFFGHGLKYYIAALTLTQLPLHVAPLLPPFWTLCYEMAFYLILAVSIFVSTKAPQVTIFTTSAVLSIFTLVWLIASPSSVPFPLDKWPEFGLGVTAFALLSGRKTASTTVSFAIQLILVTIYSVCRNTGSTIGHPSLLIEWMVSAGFACSLLLLYRYDTLISSWRPIRLLASVGMYSYSLYLTHTLVVPVVKQIGKKLHVGESHYWIVFLLDIVCAVVFARIFYHFFERPFVRSAPTVKPDVTFKTHEGGARLNQAAS